MREREGEKEGEGESVSGKERERGREGKVDTERDCIQMGDMYITAVLQPCFNIQTFIMTFDMLFTD